MGEAGSSALAARNGARRARLASLYATMLRIRAFEDAAEEASRGGVAVFGQQAAAKPAAVRGPLHLSTGQEAVAAGVCANLHRADCLTSTHRGHGHTIAKGGDVGRMMQELYGRGGGSCGGRGGSMHIADFGVGMLGANGVVAAGMPIAVGAAHSVRIRGATEMVACFFGDGAINRGPFAESLNWAQVFRLPVLFVCEDNRWSATTATGSLTAGDGAAARARAHGMEALAVDGNDVEAVDAATAGLVAAVRSGGGPRFLHAITYRIKGHVSVDPAAYRDAAELEAARATDPLLRARTALAGLGAGETELEALASAARAEIAAAVAAAEGAAPASSASAYSEIQDCGAGRWRS
jgi:acetoin:2,6-dichlorophenolindophenol oxidoreductase subunit alpha